MIPYMHQDLAAEHIADILEQAHRDRTARLAKRTRRLSWRSAEPQAVLTPLVQPSVLPPRHVSGVGNQHATERREVA